MTRLHIRPSACGLALVLATVVFGISPRAAQPDTTKSASIAPVRPAVLVDGVLPAGFSASVSLATRQQFVRVVANDIDRDGDLDVVANVGSLDLLVWENDGTGHFSPSPARRRNELQTQQPEPSFDGDLIASNEGTQNDDGRDLRLEGLRSPTDDCPETVPFARAPVVDPPTDRSVRVPRAPPLTLPL